MQKYVQCAILLLCVTKIQFPHHMRHPIAEEIAVIHMDETQTRVQGIRYPVRPRNLLHRSRHHEQFHNRRRLNTGCRTGCYFIYIYHAPLMSLFTKITHCRHFREGGPNTLTITKMYAVLGGSRGAQPTIPQDFRA